MTRKIIFKGTTGSRLYGTNTPESDIDYNGVFLPSAHDFLGVETCPTEWTNNSEGTDDKLFSLKRFLQLAAQGQPGQLELLFVPKDLVLIQTPEWDRILASKHLIISKKGIQPFIGFALAQAHKSTIKGSNLNIIRDMIRILSGVKQTAAIQTYFDTPSIAGHLNAELIKVSTNEHGFQVLEIAGRKYDVNLKTSTFLHNLRELERRYGERSEAAAKLGTDFKSLMHAERLINQAEEYLLTGHITMPRPEADDLKAIRHGTHGRMDWHDYLQERITRIKTEILPKSPLPDAPDMQKLNRLCVDILLKHLEEN